MNKTFLMKALQPLVGCVVRGRKIVALNDHAICPVRAAQWRTDLVLVFGPMVECGACGGVHPDGFHIASQDVVCVQYRTNTLGVDVVSLVDASGKSFEYVIQKG